MKRREFSAAANHLDINIDSALNYFRGRGAPSSREVKVLFRARNREAVSVRSLRDPESSSICRWRLLFDDRFGNFRFHGFAHSLDELPHILRGSLNIHDHVAVGLVTDKSRDGQTASLMDRVCSKTDALNLTSVANQFSFHWRISLRDSFVDPAHLRGTAGRHRGWADMAAEGLDFQAEQPLDNLSGVGTLHRVG